MSACHLAIMRQAGPFKLAGRPMLLFVVTSEPTGIQLIAPHSESPFARRISEAATN